MTPKKQNPNPSFPLDGLVRYNQEVLFPALDKRFEQVERKIDQRFEKIEALLLERRDGQATLIESQANLSSVIRKHHTSLGDHQQRITQLEESKWSFA